MSYRVADPPTTEIPLDGQGKWLSVQEDGEDTWVSISGPRGGILGSVCLSPEQAQIVAAALLRQGSPIGG